ncbi:hypothetical protein JCM8097_002428 [Rhodosporidiobolus ruineniae]
MSSQNPLDNHKKAPPEVQKVVNFLRNSAGIKTKTGALAGKRHDYFKGKAAIKALRSPAYAKLGPSVPQLPSDEAAREFLHSLIPFTFFLRIHRGPTVTSGVKAIQINPQQVYAPDEYYVWLLPPNQTRQLLMAGGMVGVVLAGVMFPLWPVKMRIGVWYLSMAVLGLIAAFFGLAVVRLFLWLFTKLAVSPGIWLFPNLFADVGFVDSFIPLWGWDVPPPKKSKKTKEERALHKAEKAAKKAAKKGGAGGGHGHSHDHGGHGEHGGHSHSHGEDGPILEEIPAGERITELASDGEESD